VVVLAVVVVEVLQFPIFARVVEEEVEEID
jgi:hypothetical protein